MTKEVSITMEGVQLGSEEEPIITTASGTYHLRNGKHYIQYEEKSVEGSKSVKSLIKISMTQVEITKQGAEKSQMNFDLHDMTEIIYQTPYGSLFFEAKTTQLLITEAERLIEVTLEYSLLSNKDTISDNRTIIRIMAL